MVLCLSQDGACTDSFENFRENNLKGDLSNDITLNHPLFSLVNTFKSLSPRSSFTGHSVELYICYLGMRRQAKQQTMNEFSCAVTFKDANIFVLYSISYLSLHINVTYFFSVKDRSSFWTWLFCILFSVRLPFSLNQ